MLDHVFRMKHDIFPKTALLNDPFEAKKKQVVAKQGGGKRSQKRLLRNKLRGSLKEIATSWKELKR